MPVLRLGDHSPEVPPTGGFWLAPTAVLIGRVRLGEEASVWFGAVLRGDNEPIAIGERSNIQDLALIHTDPGFPATVGRDCTIGHRAILHGCTVGDGSLIGMGAIVLNGAVVGRNCLIGAGALVPEKRIIPDNSLVMGTPGKIVRPLESEEIQAIARSASNYLANWKRYAAGLEAGCRPLGTRFRRL